MSFTRDRIGSCSNYYNKYNTTHDNNPLMKRSRVEGSKDTLSTQAHLERELLKRMQEGYFENSDERILYLAKFGKDIFLLMMVPTLFLLVKFPKWMFVSVLPAGFRGLKKGGKNLKTLLNEHVLSRLMEISKKIAQQMSNFAKKTGEIIKTASKFFEGIRKIPEKFKFVTNRGIEALVKAYDAALEPFRKTAALIKGVIEKSQEMALIVLQQMTKVITPFKAAGHWIKNKNEAVKAFANSVKAFGKKTSQSLNKIALPLKVAARKISEVTKKLSTALAESFARHIEEPVKKFTEQVKTIAWNVIDVVRAKEQVLREWVQNAGQYAVKLYQGTIEAVIPFARSVVSRMIGLAPHSLKEFFEPMVSFVKGTFRLGKFMSKFLKEKGNSASEWVSKHMKKVKQQLSKALDWFFIQSIKLPGKIWGYMVKFVAVVAEASKRIFFMLRLLLAWIRVLIRYAFAELKIRMQ